VYFGHRWAKGLELTKRQIFFAEKDANDVNDDCSNLLLTDESEMFQKLSNVGFHDVLYRNVHRVIQDGFDVAFCNDVEKGEEPTGARPRNVFEIVKFVTISKGAHRAKECKIGHRTWTNRQMFH